MSKYSSKDPKHSSKDRMTISIDSELKESAKLMFSNVSKVLTDNLKLLIDAEEMDELDIIRNIKVLDSEKKSIEAQIKTLNKKLEDLKETKASENHEKHVKLLYNELKKEHMHRLFIDPEKLAKLAKLDGKSEDEILKEIQKKF